LLQVGVVQAAFSPNKTEVEAAIRLVGAFKEHQDKGHGAFVFEGEQYSHGCDVLSCVD
jgi:citrate lyase beta subunit